MKKTNILIVEDNQDDLKMLQSALSTNHFEVVAIASDFQAAVNCISAKNFDFVIIDIFLNGQPDGIEISKALNDPEVNTPFLFLTSSIDQHIFNLAKVEAPRSYLIKPFNRLELLYTIELSMEKFFSKAGAFARKEPVYLKNNFFVKDKDALVKINASEINYIMVQGQYCNMVTESGSFLLHSSLQNLMNNLDPSTFLRTHRNYLINLNRIERVYPDDNLIVLSDKSKIIISRKYKSEFINRYKILK